jgi:phosphoglycerate dehydrogenase-like enzyme
MPRVLLDITIDAAAVTRLRALPGVELHCFEPAHQACERPRELLAAADLLITKYPPLNLDQAINLKAMQLATVGFEHLAHLNLAERSFTVCNARGMFDTAIAEWNLAMMINLTRDLRGMIRRQDRGVWERAPAFQQEIRGKTVGLWGYGGIGRETARLARCLGLTVHVMARRPVGPRRGDFTPEGTGDPEGALPHQVFLAGQEREFLGGLDFLILALPRTRATTGMIGERELRALRAAAFILNPARGPIIQEAALIQALREGWIAGAALDTHYHYPMPADHPLWSFPNVIMTPHISGADRSTRFPVLMGELCVENVARLQAGRELLNIVSRDDLRDSQLAAG